MNLFKKIFLIITNSNRYKKKVKPYFIFVKKNLSLFSLIETEVPKEVIDNINLLIESQPYKYNVLNDRLYDVKNEIITHNKFVTDLKFISENNDFFSYDKIILNPCSFNIEKLDDLYLAIDYAKKLRNVPKIQIDFNKLKYIIKYYNELCNQYNYLEEFHKLIDLNNYNYIDYNLKKSILENIDTVIDKIDLNHLFYDEYKIPNDFDEYVKNHNQKWIMENINDPLFDEINNKKLDLEQRKAVLSDELSTLVVAGAGSGKTLTICGKIKYLLEHNVSQDDILILSYSKKSADDLQEKVSKISKSITVGTFHKI
ncbi:MAG: UvrD-helicase domain-containing protein, partial [Acholeplasmatales bacterium]|nr:UvrD-helicase domain-containing protein [Acholeplasmatales bacterium]